MARCRCQYRFVLVCCIISSICIYFSLLNTWEQEHKQHAQWSHFRPSDNEIQKPRSCKCVKCAYAKGLSDWYDERFYPDVNPLLTSQNSFLHPAVKQWWLSLQGYRKDYDVDAIVKKLFEVVPHTDPYQGNNETLCRRCAIVGNSGNLKNSSHGAKIDSHDFVMRMNRAKTSGFEKDVGSKTTHYFMYPESSHHLPPGVHFVLVPFKPLDMKWIVSALTTGQIKFTYVRVLQKLKLDQDKIMILNPTFLKYVHDNWTNHHGKYPSTGMITLLFALHICEEVSVFGFGADRSGRWHHYWENNKHAGAFQKTGVHDATFERELIRKLAEEGKITFYNGTYVQY